MNEQELGVESKASLDGEEQDFLFVSVVLVFINGKSCSPNDNVVLFGPFQFDVVFLVSQHLIVVIELEFDNEVVPLVNLEIIGLLDGQVD